ncbi:MAG TPA: 2,3,4,5-tetrahydropyridine-2,6-dicarboxylate N-acetyltransferase [Longimicrobiales bacterium]|nr:2,3,4,5-tetrahydropyridine-2,6-dicarboxylate N-acetyltransferase [Longimicrobiales bacterium]
MDYETIRDLIANARKKTPVRVYVRHDGPLTAESDDELMVFPAGDGTTILVGEWERARAVLDADAARIRYHHVENDRRNSAVPLLDLKGIGARIEPGSFIREGATIGERVIVMMGAVVNIGAEIGAGTMIDMNAVVGARALVGRDCHIGAGAVLAGVLEPPSAQPVVIEDEVLIGANAVVLEGCRVGQGTVIAAGAVVTADVPAGVVAAGQPARVIKQIDQKTKDKTGLLKELRRLND